MDDIKRGAMTYRTNEQYQQNLISGLEEEERFAQKVALMGGHATHFGPLPAEHLKGISKTPLTYYNDDNNEVSYFPSTDLLINFPTFSGMVQLKSKKVQSPNSSNPHFLLDAKEKLFMERSNLMHLPTLFVVQCESLKFHPRLTEYSFINADDLREDMNRLHCREIGRKKVFVLPLHIFQSFNTENINRLGIPKNDTQRRSSENRTQHDPRSAGQPRPGSDESISSLGHSHHVAVA